MSNVWDKFESIVNVEEVAKEKSQAVKLDAGDYLMELKSLIPDESKSGYPMLKGVFETESGKLVYYNQMLQNVNYPEMTAKNMADAVAFVEALIGRDIEFEGMPQFAGLIEAIEVGGKYIITVSYGKKDLERNFTLLKVKENMQPDKIMLSDTFVPF